MLKKPFFTISFIGWMVFVTFSSLYAFKGYRSPSRLIPHGDKLVHFTFYFVACVLGVFCIRELTRGIMPLRKAIWIMALSVICFGAIIEVIQHVFTLHRSGDWLDALANSVGTIAAVGVLYYVFSKGPALKWKI